MGFELMMDPEEELADVARRLIVDLMGLHVGQHDERSFKNILSDDEIKRLSLVSEHLFENYVKYFSTLGCQQSMILKRLLLGLQILLKGAKTAKHKIQGKLHKVSVFTQIINALNSNRGDKNIENLCVVAIKTLTLVMQEYQMLKENFKSQIGYEFCKLLFNCFDGSPTWELFEALFDMLVDGNFDLEKNCIITNAHVLDIMIRLLPYLEVDRQMEWFRYLEKIVARGTQNQAACCKINFVDSLLELFCTFKTRKLKKLTINLIASIGRHSITVRQLKRLFAEMKSHEDGGSRPEYVSDFLESLINMTRGEGPGNFFYFDGRNSGLKLPTIRWPKSGYSLSTWIHIESYNRPSKSIYRPQLLSLTNKASCFGLELYFDNKDELLTFQIVYKKVKIKELKN